MIKKAIEAKKRFSEIRFQNAIGPIIELRKKGLGSSVIAKRLATDYSIINEQTGKPFSQRCIMSMINTAIQRGILVEE